MMELGADWVFPYESVRSNYPVQQTFERFMQDLSRPAPACRPGNDPFFFMPGSF